MDRYYTDQTIIFNAAVASADSAAIDVTSFKDVSLEIAQVGFSGTIKVMGSNADTAPNFALAASASNPYDGVQAVDVQDGSTIAGNTGISSTTVTSVRNLELNTNGFKWIAIQMTRTAGSVTIKSKGFSGY